MKSINWKTAIVGMALAVVAIVVILKRNGYSVKVQ